MFILKDADFEYQDPEEIKKRIKKKIAHEIFFKFRIYYENGILYIFSTEEKLMKIVICSKVTNI